MKLLTKLATAAAILAICGCATTSAPPLAYLSLEKPSGVIQTGMQNGLSKEFSRGGWYFFNKNFRPAADMQAYLMQAHNETKAAVLKNADVQLNVPFAFDILFFGYNHANDSLLVAAASEAPR